MIIALVRLDNTNTWQTPRPRWTCEMIEMWIRFQGQRLMADDADGHVSRGHVAELMIYAKIHY